MRDYFRLISSESDAIPARWTAIGIPGPKNALELFNKHAKTSYDVRLSMFRSD